MDRVMEALAALYAAYYNVNHGNVVRWRAEVEEALAALMITYNAYLE